MAWKPCIRTLDIALSRPKGVLGYAIAAAQLAGLPWGSVHPYSHAAPVLRLEEPLWLPHVADTAIPEGLWTVDATSKGLVWTSLAAQVQAGHTIRIRRIPDAVRNRVDAATIQRRARGWFADEIGRVTYAHRDLLWFLFRIPGHWYPPAVTVAEVYRRIRVVCSAHTSASLRFGMEGVTDAVTDHDYDPLPDRVDRWSSPSDLGRREARLENLRDPQGRTVWALEPHHLTV